MGNLPNEQHGINGRLELLSTTEIRLVEFSYDGGGPGELWNNCAHKLSVPCWLIEVLVCTLLL